MHARDVSLSLTPARGSSILNIVPVVIENIHEPANGSHLVECRLGEIRLLAMLSLRSVDKLALKPGDNVYAQFKATAMVK